MPGRNLLTRNNPTDGIEGKTRMAIHAFGKLYAPPRILVLDYTVGVVHAQAESRNALSNER
jgi:hypothetical protein